MAQQTSSQNQQQQNIQLPPIISPDIARTKSMGDLTLPKSADLIGGCYKLDKTIGEGTYGKVKLAIDTRSGQKVAVKILEKCNIKSQKQVARIQREIRFLKLLHHPNIVKVYDVVETQDRIYIVMEYATGGELFDYIVTHKRVREKEARWFFRQVLSAVDYCHQNSVIHRDLKPENLLLASDKTIKIIDFGFGNVYQQDSLLDTYCGSPFYASPEMLKGIKYIGPEVDIWSLGVILFALLCGHLPFDDDNMKELYRKIGCAQYVMPSHVPDDCKYLITRMICVDPKKRATLEEIKTHRWVCLGYDGPPISHLPQRMLQTNSIDVDIVDRIVAFNYSKEEVYQQLAKYAEDQPSQQAPHPIVSTYFLLLEMLQRENSGRHDTADDHCKSMSRGERQKYASELKTLSTGTQKSSQTSSVNNLSAISEENSQQKRQQKAQIQTHAKISGGSATQYDPLSPLKSKKAGVPTPVLSLNTSTSQFQQGHGRHHSAVQLTNKPAAIDVNGHNRQQSAVIKSLLSPKYESADPMYIDTSRDQSQHSSHGRHFSGPQSAQPQQGSQNSLLGQTTAAQDANGGGIRRLSNFLSSIKRTSISGSSRSLSANNRRVSSNDGSSQQQQQQEIRQINGWFVSASTTSSKPPSALLNDILYALNSLKEAGVSYQHEVSFSPWIVTVGVDTLRFDSMNKSLHSVQKSQSVGVNQWLGAVINPSSDPAFNDSLVEDDQTDDVQETSISSEQISDNQFTTQSSDLRISSDNSLTKMASDPSFGTNQQNVCFQIEVCRVPRLNLSAFVFKRQTGGVWNYKRVCQKLLSEINSH
ncbi:hypothetical protein MP228_010386 [Amoeboaphelidium protococcarum]|nr:hypothetical protein MP228_010386 [Amoeboaphelidium protococcarum]